MARSAADRRPGVPRTDGTFVVAAPEAGMSDGGGDETGTGGETDGDGDDGSEFRRRFWDAICEYDDYLGAALAINVGLLILLLLATPGISRGSSAFVVFVIDLAILGPLIAVSAFLFWRCRTRTRERRF